MIISPLFVHKIESDCEQDRLPGRLPHRVYLKFCVFCALTMDGYASVIFVLVSDRLQKISAKFVYVTIDGVFLSIARMFLLISCVQRLKLLAFNSPI